MKSLCLFLIMYVFLLQTQLFAQNNELESNVYRFNIQKSVVAPSEYVSEYVLDSISKWKEKGRYEPTQTYQERVNVTTQKNLVSQLIEEGQYRYLKRYYLGKPMTFSIKDYDADNQSFLMYNNVVGNIILPVPLNEAEAFEQRWALDYNTISLYIDDENVRAKELVFYSGNKKYPYNDTQNAIYARMKVNINLPDPNIELDAVEELSPQIQTKEITIAQSDVDINIPLGSGVNSNSFAVIIANETYKRVSSVPYAMNDGRIFKVYCEKTLGLEDSHIRYIENATLNDIKFAISWITNIQKTQREDINVIFYYAGHGIPDEQSLNSYLLPIDGYPSDISTAISINSLYETIGSYPAQKITYFIDACFSGAKRDGEMLASARGVAIKAHKGELVGNAIAFTASSSNQTAYPYAEKEHGLFTYYLLKKLQQSGGLVNYKELADYITENVESRSVIINSKIQTPTINYNHQVSNKWESWNL